MRVYVMLPLIVLNIDNERAEFLSVLTDEYAKQFDDVKYVYPTSSELIDKKAHYTGGVGWVYTKMLPEVFKKL